MIRRLSQLRLPIGHAPEALRAAVLTQLHLPDTDLQGVTIARRGVDARKAPGIHYVYTLDLELADHAATHLPPKPDTAYRFVAHAPPGVDRPVVIGAGPCGLFAALTLAQMGFRPILIERGKPVRPRTVDTFRFWRQGILDPASNVQFGEGGAGTFSDGKLYSQVKDRAHRGRRVLETFVQAGAPEEILTVSRPHIGTFRLVTVVEHMRRTIESLGGEYRFETCLTGIEANAGRLCGIHLQTAAGGRDFLPVARVILAPGHSARETFAMVHEQGVRIAAKPFSIGVRIEHPQSLIDRDRYVDPDLHRLLGAADYRLSHHCGNGRTVYSFCMCPGGTVVAAASEPGHLVTNGMSQYSRAERNANAGLVVDVTPADFPAGPLGGIEFQRRWEQAAFTAGGGTYAAPAQRVEDFLAGRASRSLGPLVPSYSPGITPADLAACLPPYVIEAMREAIPAFARTLPGFALPDAVMTGVETRTSAPIRIERNERGQSPTMPGLFPAGEGAGYAGGILSAAIDGTRAAEALALDAVGDLQDAKMQTGSGFYG